MPELPNEGQGARADGDSVAQSADAGSSVGVESGWVRIPGATGFVFIKEINGQSVRLTRDGVIARLKELKAQERTRGEADTHGDADDLLLEYIGDKEISDTYHSLTRWFE